VRGKSKGFLMRPAFRSKNEAVHDLLRQSIINSVFEPGQRLVIDDLAAQMGVSPIPIRESLRQLEADGFVKIEPYLGATVTGLDAGSVSEIFALLDALEVISGRLACSKMNESDLTTLAEIILKMEPFLDDPDQWTQKNKDIHAFICDRAGTALVKKMMQKALDHWDRLRRYYLKDVFAHRIRSAQTEHVRILEAFRTRDPDTVEQIIHLHNRAALTAYTDYLNLPKPAAEAGLDC
jgi:DNA-binding GntR family transcriptional regulator